MSHNDQDSDELDFLDDDQSDDEPAHKPSKPVTQQPTTKPVQEVVQHTSHQDDEVEEGEEKDDGSTQHGSGDSKDNHDNIDIQQEKEEDRRSVFVQNVEYRTTKEELQEIFKKCGVIQKITIPQSRFGQGKGFAYIQFEDISSVELAKSISETIHRGRVLNVADKRTNQHGFKKNKVTKPQPFTKSPFPFLKNSVMRGFMLGASSQGYKKSFNPH